MQGIEGEQILLRVILSESRTLDHTPLYQRIVELLREEGLAGATVLKGLAGFGHDRLMHTAVIEVAAAGLPVVIEAVDTPEHIERIVPMIEALMGGGGVVMLERAKVLRYADTTGPP